MGETEFVTCRGQLHELLPGTYWHLTQPNGMMLHNVWLAEGICPSITTINRMPGMEKAASPCAIKAMADAKEQVWEATRL